MAGILDNQPHIILFRKIDSRDYVISIRHVYRVCNIVPHLAWLGDKRKGVAGLVLVPRKAELARKGKTRETRGLDAPPSTRIGW